MAGRLYQLVQRDRARPRHFIQRPLHGFPQIAVFAGWDHMSVGADQLVQVGMLKLLVEDVDRISTEEPKWSGGQQAVPIFFQPDSRGKVPSTPQHSHHLAVRTKTATS